MRAGPPKRNGAERGRCDTMKRARALPHAKTPGMDPRLNSRKAGNRILPQSSKRQQQRSMHAQSACLTMGRPAGVLKSGSLWRSRLLSSPRVATVRALPAQEALRLSKSLPMPARAHLSRRKTCDLVQSIVLPTASATTCRIIGLGNPCSHVQHSGGHSVAGPCSASSAKASNSPRRLCHRAP